MPAALTPDAYLSTPATVSSGDATPLALADLSVQSGIATDRAQKLTKAYHRGLYTEYIDSLTTLIRYKFDDNPNGLVIADSSGNARDATLQARSSKGLAPGRNGLKGGAFLGDGVAYVAANSGSGVPLSGNKSYMVVASSAIVGGSGTGTLIGGNDATNAPKLTVNSAGTVAWSPSQTAVAVQSWANVVSDTNWHHYALVWNNTSFVATLYVDGVQQPDRTYASGFNATPGVLTIGASAGGVQPWRGLIDDVSVHGGLLTVEPAIAAARSTYRPVFSAAVYT